VRNACQYTEQGAVTLTLRAGRLTVDDTGPGLPSQARERLSGQATTEVQAEAEGTGLGLSIVRRIAEHLQWGLQIEDRHGGGTRFTVAIPQLQAGLTSS
jgi:signal transduction histidine kinase